MEALQDMAGSDGVCFGCGPANPQGLKIKSRWAEDGIHVVATVNPDPRYTGWPGMVYGGFMAMLFDCHSNWTVMANHYKAEGREPGSEPKIDCVTGSLNIKYLRPTPMGKPLELVAHVEGEVGRKTRVICEIRVDGKVTAVADSIFVRVDTGNLADRAHGKKSKDCCKA